MDLTWPLKTPIISKFYYKLKSILLITNLLMMKLNLLNNTVSFYNLELILMNML